MGAFLLKFDWSSLQQSEIGKKPTNEIEKPKKQKKAKKEDEGEGEEEKEEQKEEESKAAPKKKGAIDFESEEIGKY